MAWSKQQLVSAAFEEIGVANYVFDLDPEQQQGALRRLEAMMGHWAAQGLRIGYALASEPAEASLDDDSGLPDAATEAVYTNLALRLAPTIGKAVSRDTKTTAKAAYSALLSKLVSNNARERPYPGGLPVGAGAKQLEDPFSPMPDEPLEAGKDAELEWLP